MNDIPKFVQIQMYLESIRLADWKTRAALRHLREASKLSKEDGELHVNDAIRDLQKALKQLESIKEK